MSSGDELLVVLMSGYFHQDWALEADDDLGIVHQFIKNEGVSDLQPIVDAIDRIVLANESDVSSFLSRIGCEYYFAGDGLTSKLWLMRLRLELERLRKVT